MARTPEQQAARQALLDTGRYEEYTNAAGQIDVRLKGAGQAPVAPAPVMPTQPQIPAISMPNEPIVSEGVAVAPDRNRNIAGPMYADPTTGNYIQSPIYHSPYTQQTQEALDNYNQWASQPYESQYADEIEAMVRDILSRTFDYDPADDAQFQRASKELTRNVMESMNARGILNSTVTENQVQQGVSDLLPQYQQIARQQFMDEGNQLMSQIDMLMGIDESQYGRYQDEGERLANALGIVMDMDEMQYKRWSEAYERRYRESRDKIADEQAAAEVERQKIQDAWKRVDDMRYADNETALILGIEPGTLSREAKIARDEAEQRLKEQKQSLANQLAVINAQYKKEKKLSEMRDADSAETQGTESQVSSYYTLRDIYFGGGSGQYANDPLKAYNWLMSHRQDNVGLMGEKLYNRLVGELEETMKTQKSYGETGLTQSQEFTQKNTVFKNALSMKNKILEDGEDTEAGNAEIASYIVYSGLSKPSIEEVLQQTFTIDELRSMGLWED